VRSCYNAGLTKNPNLQGRVAVNFVITGTGKVGSSVVQESTVKDSSVANCIAKAVKRWQFPKPRGGGNVIVTYPFNLEPG
ncbi:MAG: energy transducer TonB, partial [Bacteroidales bacterium]|nr:energy transducer TonB [Bacteroidales bacterium]